MTDGPSDSHSAPAAGGLGQPRTSDTPTTITTQNTSSAANAGSSGGGVVSAGGGGIASPLSKNSAVPTALSDDVTPHSPPLNNSLPLSGGVPPPPNPRNLIPSGPARRAPSHTGPVRRNASPRANESAAATIGTPVSTSASGGTLPPNTISTPPE